MTESQQDALLAAAQVCATFSLAGSLFILICFASFKHLRKLSFTLVAWLAIADVGECSHQGGGLKLTSYDGDGFDGFAIRYEMSCVTNGAYDHGAGILHKTQTALHAVPAMPRPSQSRT